MADAEDDATSHGGRWGEGAARCFSLEGNVLDEQVGIRLWGCWCSCECDCEIVDTAFGDMLRRALTMRSRQLRNLASEGPEQKRGPAKRSLDHDSRADAVESAMSVSSSSMSSPTGVVYKPASLDHEVRARVSSMSMPTRATIMTGL